MNRDVRTATQAAQERADAAYPSGYEPSENEVNGLWRGTGGERPMS